MSRRLRLLFFLVGLALLALLVAHVGPATVLGDVRRSGWALLPIVLLWTVVYALNTVSWLLLVPPPAAGESPGARIPFFRAYALCVASFALNYVTPFVALGGEALRARGAAAGLGGRRATAAMVAFRIMHTSGQLLFWLATIPVAAVLLPHTTATFALLAVVAVVLLAVDADIASIAGERPRRIALVLALEAFGRFVSALEFVLIGRTIHEPVSVGAAAVIAGFAQIVMNVLFFIPLELGTREGGLFAVYRLLGHAPSVAIYGAIVSRLREITWIGIGLAAIWLGAAGG